MRKINIIFTKLVNLKKQLSLLLMTVILAVNVSANPNSNTVVDIIVNSPDHETLEAAVLAAGLAGALSEAGPFTVFAPTDAAFALLPAGTIPALLADIPALTSILTYHVVAGKKMAGDLEDNMTLTTLNGKDVTITKTGEGAFINNVKISAVDIEADNGVVHVIDAVLLPPTSTNNAKNISKDEMMFKVYPNPASSYLNISFSDKHEGSLSAISIVRIDGARVFELSTSDSIYNLDISNLKSGVYFVMLKSGSRVYTEKLVIK